MSASGREDLTDVREWSGTLRVLWERSVGPSRCPGVVGRSFWMSESGREALLDIWEWSGDAHKRPGRPPECPGVVRRPIYGFCGSGQEALPDDREWSGDHTDFAGVVGKLSRMYGIGREARLDDRVWS